MHRLALILSKNNCSNSTSRSNMSWTAYRAQGSLQTSPGEATHCCCCSAGSHTPGPSLPLLAARRPRHQHDLVPPTMGWCLEQRRRRWLPPRRRRGPATASSRRPAQARTPRKRSAAVASTTRRAASTRLRWSSAPPSSLPLPVLPAPMGAWSAVVVVGGRRRRSALPSATRRLPEAVRSARLGIRAPAAAAASVVAAPALAVAVGWLRLLRPTACCWTSLGIFPVPKWVATPGCRHPRWRCTPCRGCNWCSFEVGLPGKVAASADARRPTWRPRRRRISGHRTRHSPCNAATDAAGPRSRSNPSHDPTPKGLRQAQRARDGAERVSFGNEAFRFRLLEDLDVVETLAALIDERTFRGHRRS